MRVHSMFSAMKRAGTFMACVAAVSCAAFLIPSAASAKKPGGGSGSGGNGGGAIYFARGSVLYVMEDDGGNLGLATGFAPGTLDAYGQPSHLLHGGNRWWLQRYGYSPPHGLLILSNAGDVVDITLQTNLEITAGPTWGVGDAAITFMGVLLDDDPASSTFGEPLIGGLFEVLLTTDSGGNLTGGAGGADLVFELPLVSDQDGFVTPDAWFYDWAPDGDHFVYTSAGSQTLRIGVVSSGSDVLFFDATAELSLGAAFWSPAGNQIMFNMHPRGSHASVMMIDADGTNLNRIQRGAPGWTRSAAAWSPTGSHLLLHHRDHHLNDSYILRMNAAGAGKSRLTPAEMGSGISGPRVRGWR